MFYLNLDDQVWKNIWKFQIRSGKCECVWLEALVLFEEPIKNVNVQCNCDRWSLIAFYAIPLAAYQRAH